MKLIEFLSVANGQVCGGSEFMWKCFPNARYLDVADIDGNEIGSCVFSTATNEVYEAEVHVYEDDVAYRWTNPNWKQAYIKESYERKLDPNVAYDGVKYTDETDEEEFLDLLFKVVHKTYVHSNYHNADMQVEDCTGGCVGCQCGNADGSSDPEEDEDNMSVGEQLAAMNASGQFDSDEYSINNVNTEYTVKITVTHVLDVGAGNMEQAVAKAKSFVSGFKPSDSGGAKVAWMDTYNTKEEVSRNLVTEQFED